MHPDDIEPDVFSSPAEAEGYAAGEKLSKEFNKALDATLRGSFPMGFETEYEDGVSAAATPMLRTYTTSTTAATPWITGGTSGGTSAGIKITTPITTPSIDTDVSEQIEEALAPLNDAIADLVSQVRQAVRGLEHSTRAFERIAALMDVLRTDHFDEPFTGAEVAEMLDVTIAQDSPEV